MRDNKNQIEIRIGFRKPFVPEKCGDVGMWYGTREITKPSDKIKNMLFFSRVYVIEYEYKGLESKLFFKHGKWRLDKNDKPQFHVWGLLKG